MNIQLELNPHELDKISYFSYGDFTFEKDGVSFSNKGKRIPGCMLLSSLPDLFDRLIRVKRGEMRKFVFDPIDCSYQLLFEKQKDKFHISEFSRQKLICGIDEFAKALYQSVIEMEIRFDFEIRSLDIARQDFAESWDEMKEVFSLNNSKSPEDA
ncbi:MAG: hypothetical protein ACO1N0_10520 [Fluviicola sp.]